MNKETKKEIRDQLHELIYIFLLNFNCMYTVELHTDDGYPLVDLLSPGITIKDGKAEIQHISKELGDEILNAQEIKEIMGVLKANRTEVNDEGYGIIEPVNFPKVAQEIKELYNQPY